MHIVASAAAQSAAALLREAGIDAALIARESRAGFKAGALAAGLSRSRAEFVAIALASAPTCPCSIWRAVVASLPVPPTAS